MSYRKAETSFSPRAVEYLDMQRTSGMQTSLPPGTEGTSGISIPASGKRIMLDALILNAMAQGTERKRDASRDTPTPEEILLAQQTEIALRERRNDTHYLVMAGLGIVMETLSGREAMVRYEDLRLDTSDDAEAFLCAPGDDFVLDGNGILKTIEEIHEISARVRGIMAKKAGLQCD